MKGSSSSNNATYESLPAYTPESDTEIFVVPRMSRTRRYMQLAYVGAVGLVALAGIRTMYRISNEDFSVNLNFDGAISTASSSNIGISPAQFDHGLAKCSAAGRKFVQKPYSSARSVNPHAGDAPKHANVGKNSGSLLIVKDARLWDPENGVVFGDLVVVDGVIRSVGKQSVTTADVAALRPGAKASDVVVINAVGKYVTPGIVDMHSHAGVDSYPSLDGTQDTNEMTNPTTPFVRTLDAINPRDPGLRIIMSGGVTTSLILPGSGNNMGGEGYVIKMRPVEQHSVERMGINYGVNPDVEPAWRWMKMACGENPKRVYGSQGKVPFTRMGSAYIMRKRFFEASKLRDKQDQWCARANQHLDGEGSLPDEPFPEDIDRESLVALLRGQVKLNVHCYMTHDIEMLLRVTNEFNVTVSALHHALDAYLVPDMIKNMPHDGTGNNITVATFADHWGYKVEAYTASVHGPARLVKAGVNVALKSDHPVLNAQHMMQEAARSFHYGLDANEALAAVTSVPARSLGLGHRIGRLAAGMDADFVVWDSHPLSNGAHPTHVFVDGIPQFKPTGPIRRPVIVNPKKPPVDETPKKSTSPQLTCPKPSLNSAPRAQSYVIRNIGRIIAGPDADYTANKVADLVLVVKDGNVACAGSSVSCKSALAKAAKADDVVEYNLDGGWVVPGLVALTKDLGLVEIEQEPTTGDGTLPAAKAESALENPSSIISAIDGLTFDNRHLEAARLAGITTAITPPMSDGLINGLSVAFRTGASSSVDKDAIIAEDAALHIQLVRDTATSTVSANVQALRKALLNAVADSTNSTAAAKNPFARVVAGDLTLAVSVFSQDHIASLLRVKQVVEKAAGHPIKVTIIGATEAWLLAEELAAADITVILNPLRCAPASWENRRCLVGPPHDTKTSAGVLARAGVKLALGINDQGFARNLIWDAGRALKDVHEGGSENASAADAIGWATWGVAEALGIKNSSVGTIRAGDRAAFVAYSSNPLEYGAEIALTADGTGKLPTCRPQQWQGY
ncbi:hypothetical protein GQ42DRAFT_160535 [Ramicandelaber brevisporus]|nr:hypothetical protein GQ42DRAFT_160535 [Ramicandelaber brevisporus]